jgi:hypothetical protein
MPSPHPPHLVARGVYIERGIPGTVEVTLYTSDGRRVVQAIVAEAVYDERFRRGMETFLDRIEPPVQLTVIPGGGA